jgi:hypothetical protein
MSIRWLTCAAAFDGEALQSGTAAACNLLLQCLQPVRSIPQCSGCYCTCMD